MVVAVVAAGHGGPACLTVSLAEVQRIMSPCVNELRTGTSFVYASAWSPLLENSLNSLRNEEILGIFQVRQSTNAWHMPSYDAADDDECGTPLPPPPPPQQRKHETYPQALVVLKFKSKKLTMDLF